MHSQYQRTIQYNNQSSQQQHQQISIKKYQYDKELRQLLYEGNIDYFGDEQQEQKFIIDPKANSKYFYDKNIEEIENNKIQRFEDFQKFLKKSKKTIKIKINLTGKSHPQINKSPLNLNSGRKQSISKYSPSASPTSPFLKYIKTNTLNLKTKYKQTTPSRCKIHLLSAQKKIKTQYHSKQPNTNKLYDQNQKHLKQIKTKQKYVHYVQSNSTNKSKHKQRSQSCKKHLSITKKQHTLQSTIRLSTNNTLYKKKDRKIKSIIQQHRIKKKLLYNNHRRTQIANKQNKYNYHSVVRLN